VGTTTYTATSALTADFTHDSAPRVPGFTGTVIENGVRRLSALAPASGFLRTPSLPRFSTWSVVSAGTPTGTFLNLSESEEGWRNSSASLGYYDGLPPGTYDVTIKTRDGRTMAYRGVEVRAGEVTDLNALQPVVTFSTELSASKALRINRAADGSFTVERTYTVQGKPAATDFVISYYYSTDPYGKTNVTYLGSETISSTADKSLGEHTATSPSFKITTSGTYYVFARIDTDGVIEENDETDNLFAPIKIVI
jgi:hypothetical protein